jgi:hypothetical protein
VYLSTSARWNEALAGGSLAPVATHSVTYDGRVIAQSLPVEPGGTISSEFTGDMVATNLNLTVADDTGALFNASARSPLMPFGQRIRSRNGLADRPNVDDQRPNWYATVPMGEYRITRSYNTADSEPWRMYPNGAWVANTQRVQVEGRCLLQQLGQEPFTVPMQPLTGGTVRSEIIRVLGGFMPVAAWPGISNPTVPSQMVYDQSRLTTLCDLANLAGAVPWAGRDGALRLLKPTLAATAVADVKVADSDDPDGTGNLFSWNPNIDVTGLVNAWQANSTDTLGNPLRGSAYRSTGALRWGGPFGRVLRDEDNSTYTSNAQAKAGAKASLIKNLDTLSVPVEVSIIPNPALDVLDTVRVVTPDLSVLALITKIVYPQSADRMQVTLSLKLTDLVTL